MKTKPSRAFIYLSLVMVILLALGLLAIGILVANNRASTPFQLTSDAIISNNKVAPGVPLGTYTFEAAQTQTQATNYKLTEIFAQDLFVTISPNVTFTPDSLNS
jgi:hypothetical protein